MRHTQACVPAAHSCAPHATVPPIDLRFSKVLMDGTLSSAGSAPSLDPPYYFTGFSAYRFAHRSIQRGEPGNIRYRADREVLKDGRLQWEPIQNPLSEDGHFNHTEALAEHRAINQKLPTVEPEKPDSVIEAEVRFYRVRVDEVDGNFIVKPVELENNSQPKYYTGDEVRDHSSKPHAGKHYWFGDIKVLDGQWQPIYIKTPDPGNVPGAKKELWRFLFRSRGAVEYTKAMGMMRTQQGRQQSGRRGRGAARFIR